MPILLTDREHCELRGGLNSLGGDAPDSIRLAQLAAYPLVGTIELRDDAPPTIRRLSSRIAVKVNGTMLGAMPHELTEGTTLQVGDVRMSYFAHVESAAAVAPAMTRRRRESELATQVMSAIGGPARPAVLVAPDTGKVFRLPDRDVVLGRSEEADLRLAGNGVSRRHAVVCAAEGVYTLVDESTNGTFVNGARVNGRTVLKAGDTITLGDARLRFEHLDPASAGTGQVPSALAELEVVGGRGARKSYSISRPVCAIGSGTHNDVRIDDDSISPSHATLMLKGETWYLTDLRSASGTYLDGYRVAGERALSSGAVIGIGQVAMAFWPVGAHKSAASARSAGGLLRKLKRLLTQAS